MKRSTLRHLGMLLCLLLLIVSSAGCSAAASQSDAPEPLPAQIAEAVSDRSIIAEGRIVPRQSVDLHVAAPGRVTAVLAHEGQAVENSEAILQLDDAAQRAAVAQAQAGVDAAQAALDGLLAGPRAEAIAAAESAVAAAETQLALAIAQAEHTRLGVDIAESGVSSAQAGLDDLLAGPSASERAIMAKQVELARNELWAAQGYRDGVKGAHDRKQAQEYDVDQAEAAVGMAYVAHEIIIAQEAQLDKGARPGVVTQAREAVVTAKGMQAQAEAAIPVAEAQIEGARAAVAQAKAQADLARLPATPEQLDQARAAVAQAQAILDAAQAGLETRILYAPMAGKLTTLSADVGQQLTGLETVARLADLKAWEIETEDLTEIEVVHIEVGQSVTVKLDALPSLELPGTVVSISDDYVEERGDITYRVNIRLDETDPRLRWGMTVEVVFK